MLRPNHSCGARCIFLRSLAGYSTWEGGSGTRRACKIDTQWEENALIHELLWRACRVLTQQVYYSLEDLVG
jgi:hypothetical protein